MIFLAPNTEDEVLRGAAGRLVPGGLLVSGFARWATWSREEFSGGDYAVSVHRRPAS
jgi:hypothetical protein